MYCTHYPSLIGTLTLVSDGTALTELRMDTQPVSGTLCLREDLPLFQSVKAWLDGYFSGQPGTISFLLCPAGTPFQKQVWNILLTIPYGQTTTYGAIAREISPTMSAQAVGQAVGQNPIGIIIPCHRCIGSHGQLTGYAAGLEKKKWLLQHESTENIIGHEELQNAVCKV